MNLSTCPAAPRSVTCFSPCFFSLGISDIKLMQKLLFCSAITPAWIPWMCRNHVVSLASDYDELGIVWTAAINNCWLLWGFFFCVCENWDVPHSMAPRFCSKEKKKSWDSTAFLMAESFASVPTAESHFRAPLKFKLVSTGWPAVCVYVIHITGVADNSDFWM